MGRVIVSFSLDTEEDRDILRWLERQESKSAAIREALRSHLVGGVTLGDVYQAVKDLERLMRSGVVLAAGPADPQDEPDEPPDLAAALEALGKL
ncbi:MAG: hypothetical protein NZ821_07335 [Gloeomargarita sp. SKYB31]|nr:hypothetical protein [Gloeomargarita sp. SKYB31]